MRNVSAKNTAKSQATSLLEVAGMSISRVVVVVVANVEGKKRLPT
jgi:antitoxin component of RelBE/YafQ-DinJ toxin-antitoxin module